ncbi:AbrB/MazE/SpoVT family DNA-binding domain-containing protein [Acutalibacter muris]|jgi:bifunctional DNA-binding transcriptional regulator/antitoxin component of YhaV-PrlF toxin-antitoxin module|uniref:AbrB/MazE/SpoVT family DNA-binding domain-containing protein n=1 Tax=Acutalibacter muris TaxID=1796620 RepID=UPI0026F39714|nr:AbrB/MazE/SpoVT family DNA-binding domain-containing protein [Acutalibacter muris]
MNRKLLRILGKRGRITIPFEIRQRVGFAYNDVLSFTESSDGRTVIVRREKLCDDCQGKTVRAMTDDRAMLMELLDSLPMELKKAAFVQLSESLGRLPKREIRTGPPHREIQRKRGAVLADQDIPN